MKRAVLQRCHEPPLKRATRETVILQTCEDNCSRVVRSKSQLLVVTHSPQVAARAAHHYRIEKAHEDGVTRTTVRKLTPDERREEIARMLSGAAITDEARAQAARLLEAA